MRFRHQRQRRNGVVGACQRLLGKLLPRGWWSALFDEVVSGVRGPNGNSNAAGASSAATTAAGWSRGLIFLAVAAVIGIALGTTSLLMDETTTAANTAEWITKAKTPLEKLSTTTTTTNNNMVSTKNEKGAISSPEKAIHDEPSSRATAKKPKIDHLRQPSLDVASTTTASAAAQLQWPPPKSDYAYVFVLGGVDRDNPKYRMYLYGVYVTAYLLRKHGSKADFVLFYRMLHGSPHGDLPAGELSALRKMNIISRKLPKAVEDFYNIQLTKFRALVLTQYRRIMYLDSDFVPLGNADYIFEQSDEGVTSKPLLKENLVVLGTKAPSNGGMFMLAPRPGDLELVNGVIKAKEDKTMNGIAWDNTTGWGEEMGFWNGTKLNGTGWSFMAAEGDQGTAQEGACNLMVYNLNWFTNVLRILYLTGLLWYWVAFIKKAVSVVVPCDTIENWAAVPGVNGGRFGLQEVLHEPFGKPESEPFNWTKCKTKPLSDFFHFMGNVKGPAKHGCRLTKYSSSMNKSATNHWCYALKELSDEYRLGIDVMSLQSTNGTIHHPAIKRNFEQGAYRTNLLDWE